MLSKRVGSVNEKVKKRQYERKKKDRKSCHKKYRKKTRHHNYSSLEISSNEEKSLELEEISKKQKLEKLRQERLDREAKERKRFTSLLTFSVSNKEEMVRSISKYNSQFNPALARQNQIH